MIVSTDNGFHIQDQIVGSTSYYGFMDTYGHWYIMKSVDAGGGEINYSYASSKNNTVKTYSWADRASYVFGAYSAIF